MDACGSRRLFYQRFVWLCQHAGIYSNSQFWIGKCQYFDDCACLFSKRNTDITSNIEKA